MYKMHVFPCKQQNFLEVSSYSIEQTGSQKFVSFLSKHFIRQNFERFQVISKTGLVCEICKVFSQAIYSMKLEFVSNYLLKRFVLQKNKHFKASCSSDRTPK